jgi:hypothetical protein
MRFRRLALQNLPDAARGGALFRGRLSVTLVDATFMEMLDRLLSKPAGSLPPAPGDRAISSIVENSP